MKILVIGSGGREHALAWKVSLSESVEQVYAIPGNAGTAGEDNIENVDIDIGDFSALAGFAEEVGASLTIVGPEVPLVAGITDYFQARGLKCFGPSRAAAQLEGSKAFTKDFLKAHAMPTAASETFTDLDDAKRYVESQGAPIVIKADGLAAGKGVVVARDLQQAVDALEDMLSGNAFGDAGSRVVVEEFLEGEEASFICLCDGKMALPFASSQDHKAAYDGDEGPNTGGMGAYSPAPVVTEVLHDRIMREIVEPTMAGMAADGAPYVGFLYAGLMIGADGTARVIEFNCRFGDPEAQPVLMRLRSDLATLIQAALTADLEGIELDWDPRASLGVVMAAGGYPGTYAKGTAINGLDRFDDADVKAFHAGTRLNGEDVVTNGGRVLCVVGLGEKVSDAQHKAYQGVERITWQGAYYRTDIGYRAVARESR